MEVKLLGASVLKADIIGVGGGKQGIYFAFSATGSEIEDLGNNPRFSHSGTTSSNGMCAKIYPYFFLQNNFLQSPRRGAAGVGGGGGVEFSFCLMKKKHKNKNTAFLILLLCIKTSFSYIFKCIHFHVCSTLTASHICCSVMFSLSFWQIYFLFFLLHVLVVF